MSRRVERVRVGTAKLPAFLAAEISSALRASIQANGQASLCLAGGTTPRAAYEQLASQLQFPWTQISFYFGDERCVPPDHPDSNYGMAKAALFDRLPLAPQQIYRMQAERPDREQAARDYESALPPSFDVLVLGVGEDGHTASLFPHSPALAESSRRVLAVLGPKPPPERLTVTPPVLASAKLVITVAAGAGKARAVAQALEGDLDIQSCPVQLVRDSVWIVDHAAAADLSGVWK